MQNLTQIQQKVQNYLLAGISPARIADLTGASPSYISELLGQSDFLQAAKDAQAEAYLAARERDARLDTIEDTLAEKVQTMTANPLTFLDKPLEAVRALQMINSLKRRTTAFGTPEDDLVGAQRTVVKLTMPVAIINNFTVAQDDVKMDSKGNIIEVQDVPFVTIQSTQLEQLAQTVQQAGEEKCQPLSNIKSITNLPMEAFS